MTNFSTIETPIRDIVALVYACVGLNLRFVPDSWCRGEPAATRRGRLLNAMSHTLRSSPSGTIECLYTEAIDLHALGRLHVVRATVIVFCEKSQQ